MNNVEIIEMSRKLYFGTKKPDTTKLEFSVEESNVLFNETLIKEAMDYAHLPYEKGKFTYADFTNPLVQWKLFNLVGVAVQAIIPKIQSNSFDRFCDYQNVAWNDQLVYEVTSPDLFTVSKVANGVLTARKQKLDRRSIKLYPVMRQIRIGEDLYRLLSGRVNWAEYVQKVGMSLAAAQKADIYTAFAGSYDATNSTYFTSGSLDKATFLNMTQHVEAANGGAKVNVFGTKIALSKFTSATGFMSYNMMDEYNNMGYLGTYAGVDLIELEQGHVPNTDTFIVDDTMAIITPVLDKPVKFGTEGQIIVSQIDATQTKDQSVEYLIQQAWDVAVLAAGKYGMYKITG